MSEIRTNNELSILIEKTSRALSAGCDRNMNKFDYRHYDKLKAKDEFPNFAFVVLISDGMGNDDYYLFRIDEFEQAYGVLKQEAAKDAYSLSSICEIDRSRSDGEFRLKPSFVIRDGKIIYTKWEDVRLHVLWYMRSGNWLNPRDDI